MHLEFMSYELWISENKVSPWPVIVAGWRYPSDTRSADWHCKGRWHKHFLNKTPDWPIIPSICMRSDCSRLVRPPPGGKSRESSAGWSSYLTRARAWACQWWAGASSSSPGRTSPAAGTVSWHKCLGVTHDTFSFRYNLMFDLVYGWPYSTEIFRIKNDVQKSEGNLHYDIEWHPSLPNFLLNNIKTF